MWIWSLRAWGRSGSGGLVYVGGRGGGIRQSGGGRGAEEEGGGTVRDDTVGQTGGEDVGRAHIRGSCKNGDSLLK